DYAKSYTATPSETDIFELLLSLVNSSSTTSNVRNPSELLEDVVNKHGLTGVENDGTGDCLFQALSHQMAYTQTANIDHRDLRQNLVTYVMHHPQLPNGEHVTTQFDTTIMNDWEKYIS
ncbi:unnamed protein product, partial [Owenia fusiformis]